MKHGPQFLNLFIVNIISCGLPISDFLLGGLPFNRLIVKDYHLPSEAVISNTVAGVRSIKKNQNETWSTIPQFALINVYQSNIN